MCDRTVVFAKNELEINLTYTFGLMFFGIFVLILHLRIPKVYDIQKQKKNFINFKWNWKQKQKTINKIRVVE